MNKYIELICVRVIKADVDMGLEDPNEMDFRMSIKPSEVIGVREVEEEGCIVIMLKSGEEHYVRMGYEAIMEILNTW